MEVKKAVITAAGRGVRTFPAANPVHKGMLPIADRDGLTKPVIQIIAEEAIESGIEEVCIVCAPGDADQYVATLQDLRENLLQAYAGHAWAREQAERLDALLRRLRFAVQDEPLGYGHAVYCARDFVGGDPFLLLLGDHLYLSFQPGRRCAAQVLELARAESCPVAAVQATREHLVGHYGTLSGKREPNKPGVYQIEKIIEKPSVSRAELELQTPGLRVGHYLCLFGTHVLPPVIFDLLAEDMARTTPGSGDYQLTPALQELARRQRYLALELAGRRFDIGTKFGFAQAQIALALSGNDRDEALTMMLETLAEAQRDQARIEAAR